MKKIIAFLSVLGLAIALHPTPVLAAEKEVTVKGEAKCGMCMLSEGSACNTVIQTQKDGKTVSYYVVDNDVSKAFHEDICHGAKKVVAKGTVSDVDGKKKLTLKKIELAAK
jgi:hypothetical protein